MASVIKEKYCPLLAGPDVLSRLERHFREGQRYRFAYHQLLSIDFNRAMYPPQFHALINIAEQCPLQLNDRHWMLLGVHPHDVMRIRGHFQDPKQNLLNGRPPLSHM